MYVHMLARPEFALRFNNVGVPRWEDRAVRWGFPLFPQAHQPRPGHPPWH